MNQKLYMLAGWLMLAFIAFATLAPIDDRPTVAGPQFEHFAAFAVLGFAFARGYSGRVIVILAIVIGSAFTLEALQLLTPDRHGRVLDALVKAGGGVCGVIAARLLPLLLRDQIDRIKGALGRPAN